jgi:two-component system osmolarity sensor histidine kinase EnvZ
MRNVPQAEYASRVFAPAYAVQQLLITYREGATITSDPQRQTGTIDRPLAQALSERVRRPFAIDSTSLPRDVRIQIQLTDGVLDVKVPREFLFTSTTYLVVVWMVGTAVILVVIALLFMANQIRPIRRLAEAAERFGKGLEVDDFKPSGATEVRQAAAAFLAMQERIRRQIAQRTALLAGVSHDLRTPLTRMKLQLALLRPSREVEDLKHDIADMEKMVEGYLAFARGEGTEKPKPSDLTEILAEVASAAARDGHTVTLENAPGLVLPLRPQAIKRCFTNLVDNALRFAGKVQIRAVRRGGVAEITVDDDGPGIPPERREDVFKPFFRMEESRNLATGGVGLGLTIARDIARSHGGDVTLGTSPLGGLRATIRLPF